VVVVVTANVTETETVTVTAELVAAVVTAADLFGEAVTTSSLAVLVVLRAYVKSYETDDEVGNDAT